MRKLKTSLKQAHERVQQILHDKRQVLEDLYQLLMEQEVVEGEALRNILSKSELQAPQ